MNATLAAAGRRPKVGDQMGFTLIELMMVIGIVGVLATIALPVYQRYLERAHLASVFVELESLRSTSQLIAAENGRDLCQWRQQPASPSGQRDLSGQFENLIKQLRANLDPKLWDSRYIYLDHAAEGEPLTVQLGAQGDLAGVARARLLAEELQKVGLLSAWKRNTEGGVIFTVPLGSCSTDGLGTGPSTTSPTVTNSSTSQPPVPASSVSPAIVPPREPASSPSHSPSSRRRPPERRHRPVCPCLWWHRNPRSDRQQAPKG